MTLKKVFLNNLKLSTRRFLTLRSSTHKTELVLKSSLDQIVNGIAYREQRQQELGI